jgi:CBS domain-containing protein
MICQSLSEKGGVRYSRGHDRKAGAKRGRRSRDEVRATMRKQDPGGAPVIDGGKVIGIILTRDLLEAFPDVYLATAARLDMVPEQGKFDLGLASRIIAEHGGEIIGIGYYRQRWAESPVFYLRLRAADPEHLADVLRAEGYNVLGVHLGSPAIVDGGEE